MTLREYELSALCEYMDSACDQAYGRRNDACGHVKILAYRECARRLFLPIRRSPD